MITTQNTHMTIADYCQAMNRKEIVVNKDYQRSDKVWPYTAKSFLVESIMLGYPIPKIYLNSITNLETRQTKKEIVDGQQRSRSIHDYYSDKFALSRNLATEEIRGLKYSQLDPKWQSRFISYSLSIDLFLAADPKEVTQIFTRMNSYTVPLNPEEKRHAEYQGDFKWFVYKMSDRYGVALKNMGIFTEKNLVRMQDMKLFTEICHAIEEGVTTTSKTSLNRLYKTYDSGEESISKFENHLVRALDIVCTFQFLAGTQLAKSHILYSLVLAVINSFNPIPNCEKQTFVDLSDLDEVERRLCEMSDALELAGNNFDHSNWREFVYASSSRTNVKTQRQKRISAFESALSI